MLIIGLEPFIPTNGEDPFALDEAFSPDGLAPPTGALTTRFVLALPNPDALRFIPRLSSSVRMCWSSAPYEGELPNLTPGAPFPSPYACGRVPPLPLERNVCVGGDDDGALVSPSGDRYKPGVGCVSLWAPVPDDHASGRNASESSFPVFCCNADWADICVEAE